VEDEDEASSAAYAVAASSAGDSSERSLISQSIGFLCVGLEQCWMIGISSGESFNVLTVCKNHNV
jgi:hypothetical protein